MLPKSVIPATLPTEEEMRRIREEAMRNAGFPAGTTPGMKTRAPIIR